jgi:hypothetical protein
MNAYAPPFLVRDVQIEECTSSLSTMLVNNCSKEGTTIGRGLQRFQVSDACLSQVLFEGSKILASLVNCFPMHGFPPVLVTLVSLCSDRWPPGRSFGFHWFFIVGGRVVIGFNFGHKKFGFLLKEFHFIYHLCLKIEIMD